MELAKAQAIAEGVKAKLEPYCEPDRCVIAGSIRRECPTVHDIDMVLSPASVGQLYYELGALGQITIGGQKLIRVQLPRSLAVDVYIATPETWATLLLIRTGSAAHNVMLCTLAKRKGMKLHADGSGLYGAVGTPEERRLAGDSEASIFETLGLPYKEPPERE